MTSCFTPWVICHYCYVFQFLNYLGPSTRRPCRLACLLSGRVPIILEHFRPNQIAQVHPLVPSLASQPALSPRSPTSLKGTRVFRNHELSSRGARCYCAGTVPGRPQRPEPRARLLLCSLSFLSLLKTTISHRYLWHHSHTTKSV